MASVRILPSSSLPLLSRSFLFPYPSLSVSFFLCSPLYLLLRSFPPSTPLCSAGSRASWRTIKGGFADRARPTDRPGPCCLHRLNRARSDIYAGGVGIPHSTTFRSLLLWPPPLPSAFTRACDLPSSPLLSVQRELHFSTLPSLSSSSSARTLTHINRRMATRDVYSFRRLFIRVFPYFSFLFAPSRNFLTFSVVSHSHIPRHSSLRSLRARATFRLSSLSHSSLVASSSLSRSPLLRGPLHSPGHLLSISLSLFFLPRVLSLSRPLSPHSISLYRHLSRS